MTTAQTDQITSSPRHWFNYCLENGVKVWTSYGQAEVTGYVLEVTKHAVTVQDASCGHLVRIALAAVEETVEAS